MNYYHTRFLLLTGSMLFSLFLIAQDSVRVYTTARVEGSAPIIDGQLTDEAWSQVPWSDSTFTVRRPNAGDPAKLPTKFKVLYDDDNLYILVYALDDDPSKIREIMSRRDGFAGDMVEINIDSYHDKRNGFSFSATAGGVRGDEFITLDGENWDESWNPLWALKTQVTDKGWIAELSIPFTQLRFNANEEQVWGFNVMRRIFRDQEDSYWQKLPVEGQGFISKFGELHGIKNIQPRRQVEISPYVVTYLDTKGEVDENNPYDKKSELGVGAGLDGKIGLTNDIILDFTINPDFRQVEADPSQVNLSAFENFFEERRPFFIEGANILDFQLTQGGSPYSNDNIFYSRRIGRSPQYYPSVDDNEYVDIPNNTRILGAAKVSGKTKSGLSIGVIESLTSRVNAKISDNTTERKEQVEPLTNYLVASVRQNLNDNNTILGGMFSATNRIGMEEHLNFLVKDAYAFGLDATQFFKNKKYMLNGKIAMSHVSGSNESILDQYYSSRRFFQRPDNDYVSFDTEATQMTGFGGDLSLRSQKNSGLNFLTWLSWRNPKFELNDVGFLRQGDILFEVLWVGYQSPRPKSFYRQLNVNINQWAGFDWGGNRNFLGGNINGGVQLKNFWGIEVGLDAEVPNLSNTQLRGGPSMKGLGNIGGFVWLGSDDRKDFRVGGFFGFDKASEDNGMSQRLGLRVNYRPTDAIRLFVGPTLSWQTDPMQYVETTTYDDQDEYVFAKIHNVSTNITVRMDWVVTPDFTVQYYGAPFIFAADYEEGKFITQPKADNYYDRFSHDLAKIGLNDGYINDYDFNFQEFQSNLLLRWEYKPGSLLYLVWTQSRNGSDPTGEYNFGKDFSSLFSKSPQNTFLLKLSYNFHNFNFG